MKKLITLSILIMTLLEPVMAAGEKAYSVTLPAAGLQRNPRNIKTAFNEALEWLNDIYEDTDNGANAYASLLTDGNGSFFLNDVIRSTVPINYTAGNGTNGQLLKTDGDGTWSLVTATNVLTTGDKKDIYVSNGSNSWLLANKAMIYSFNGASADNKLVPGAEESLVNGKLLVYRGTNPLDLPALTNGATYNIKAKGYFRTYITPLFHFTATIGSANVLDTGDMNGLNGTQSGFITIDGTFTVVAQGTSGKTIGGVTITQSLENGDVFRWTDSVSGTDPQTVTANLDGSKDLNLRFRFSGANGMFHFTNIEVERVY